MQRERRRFLAWALWGVGFCACGALDSEAPVPPPRPQTCRSLGELAPAVYDAARSGRAEGLRQVLESSLLASPIAGEPAPVLSIMSMGFHLLRTFAADAPELGGNPCNDVDAPEPRIANRLCESRRLIRLFVHGGQANAALRIAKPQLAALLDYMVGGSPKSPGPHYEAAGVISGMCSATAVCRPEDSYALLGALISFLAPDRGGEALGALLDLVSDPGLTGPNGLLTHFSNYSGGSTRTGAEAWVALGQAMLGAVEAAPADSGYFDSLAKMKADLLDPQISASYPSMQPKLDRVFALLKDMLNPLRPDPVLQPLKRGVHCVSVKDPNSEFIRLFYGVGADAQTVGIKELLGMMQELRALDTRGALFAIAREALETLRRDDEGSKAVAKACAALFSTNKVGGTSNAERVLPVLRSAVQSQMLEELMCVTDTLLFGCAGGSQPACPNPP